MRGIFSLFKKNLADYLSIMIFALGSGLVVLLQIYFHEAFHYSILESAILLGVAGAGRFIGTFLCNPYIKIFSNIVDKLQLKGISAVRMGLALISLLTGILFVLFAISNNYTLFIGLSFLLGVSLSIFYPINQVLIFENTDVKEAVKIASLQRWFTNLGLAISFTLLSFMVLHAKVLFYFMAACMLISVVCMMTKIRQISEFDHKDIKDKSKKGDGNFYILSYWLLGVFLGMLAYSQITSTFAVYVYHYHNIDSGTFSRLMLINVLMVVVFQFVTPLFEKRINLNVVTALGVALIGVGIMVGSIFQSNITLILSFVVWSAGEILFFGMAPVYIKLFADGNKAASLRYSTYFYAVFYLARSAGPILGSWLYGAYMAPSSILTTAFLLALISAGLFLFLKTKLNGHIFSEKQN